MARSNAARRELQAGDESVTPLSAAQNRSKGARKSPVELDRVIHERVRLAIVSALAVTETMTFNELKDLLDITDGNLSVHARRLEEAGLVASEKSFVERTPRTQFRLTDAGRVALDNYLNHMETLIRRVREK